MAFTPFTSTHVHLTMPFLFIKYWDDYGSTYFGDGTTEPIINCGFLASASMSGGQEFAEIEAVNQKAAILHFSDKHTLQFEMEFMEACDTEFWDAIFNAGFGVNAYAPILATPPDLVVSAQLLVPQRTLHTKLAMGYYLPKCLLVPKYDKTFDGKSGTLIGATLIPEPVIEKAVTVRNVLGFRLEYDLDILIGATGCGYDGVTPNFWSVCEGWCADAYTSA